MEFLILKATLTNKFLDLVKKVLWDVTWVYLHTHYRQYKVVQVRKSYTCCNGGRDATCCTSDGGGKLFFFEVE